MMTTATATAAGSDRPAIAAEFANRMRDGRARLADLRRPSPMRANVYRAVRGVLRYSDERQDLEDARTLLLELAIAGVERRLTDDVSALRSAGAIVHSSHIRTAARELGGERAARELAEIARDRGDR